MPLEAGRLTDKLYTWWRDKEEIKRLKNVIEDLLTLLGMVIKFIYSYGKFGEGRKSNLNAEFSQGGYQMACFNLPLKVNRVARRSD